MGEQSLTATGDWISCRSKSRPDRFYRFNKKTGETDWCTENDNAKSVKAITLKGSQTPAQDRLKRLQNVLEKKRINETSVKKERNTGQSQTTKNGSTLHSDVKEAIISPPLNESKDNQYPICSKKNKKQRKRENKKLMKQMQMPNSAAVDSLHPETPDRQPVMAVNSIRPNQKQKSDVFIFHDKNRSCVNTPVSESHASNTKGPVEEENSNEPQAHSDTEDKTSSKPGFIHKIKKLFNQISDIVMQSPKKSQTNKSKESGIAKVSKTAPKSRIITKPNKAIIRGLLQENDNENINIRSPSIVRNLPAPTAPVLPPVPNESANERLQRLRKSFQLQATSQANKPPSIPPVDVTFVKEQFSLQSSTSDCEPMDWQPISDEEPSNEKTEVTSQRSSSSSEYFDRVNENLLRLAAEKSKSKQWKADHFYFVVDTNVFINCLTFVDELTKMKLCDTQGTLIYVPYRVLQELDKLKIRHSSESIKLHANRAIKYLNKAFEGNDQRIHAQSAADELNHIIAVDSPDDSILNCCLQVKKHVDNVLLLTEDVNLQNKAICSNILVSSKSDLISKHESLI